MPKITRLEASKHVRGRVLVFFQEEELVKLTEDEVLLRNLFAGKELSAQEYAALVEDSRLSSAKSAAARLCSSKLLSRGELLQKLREKGEDPVCAERAADWLEELGVLDDSRYAASVARHYAARGYGRKKLEQEFFRRKIPRELWPRALEELPDSAGTIDHLIRQRLSDPADPKELNRVQNFLLRRGFSWEEVREGLDRYLTDLEWDTDTPPD